MASGIGLRYFIKVNLQIGGVSLYTLRLYLLYCSVNSVDTLTPVLTQLCAGGNGRTRRGSRTFHNARQTPPTPLCSPLQPVHLSAAAGPLSDPSSMLLSDVFGFCLLVV